MCLSHEINFYHNTYASIPVTLLHRIFTMFSYGNHTLPYYFTPLPYGNVPREVVHSIIEQGGNAVAIQADLSKVAEVRRLFDEAEKAVGKLDILIANAADVVIKNMVDCTEVNYAHVF